MPEEFRNDPAFANFKNLEDLCKSYRFAKQTIGKKTIGMITDQSTPEEVENFYRQLGKPESPDGYQAKFSDKMPEIFRQPEVFGKYLGQLRKEQHHRETGRRAARRSRSRCGRAAGRAGRRPGSGRFSSRSLR